MYLQKRLTRKFYVWHCMFFSLAVFVYHHAHTNESSIMVFRLNIKSACNNLHIIAGAC